ncbi:MAG: helix-turn-helix domain-containing protein [Candidatus Abyssobacteria bacterium SURF_5]|uniref:Helix-turn-helix domain-containing protein n=1 Tax=Abyssobacteria bacterium (strain SURF_5) TaxID=2093360 RepID=A0A3A4N8I3_ABYX5|nr:MAG: helix-turn-helix domain-containing protein [Candidatus Abyssubacteria bacterium SURF_5]
MAQGVIAMRIGEKIRFLRKSRVPKMTSSELAQKAGISQSYVIEIESGKKNPSLEVLERIAKALNVSLSEIIIGPVSPVVPTRYRYIPVINRVSCGEWMDAGDLEFPPGFGADYKLTDSQDPNAFYVIAEGDSMVGGRIQEGDYLLVSPNLQCDPGDIVLAKSEQGVTIKRFMKRGNQIVLEPLNSKYKGIVIKEGSDVKFYRIAEIKIPL